MGLDWVALNNTQSFINGIKRSYREKIKLLELKIKNKTTLIGDDFISRLIVNTLVHGNQFSRSSSIYIQVDINRIRGD